MRFSSKYIRMSSGMLLNGLVQIIQPPLKKNNRQWNYPSCSAGWVHFSFITKCQRKKRVDLCWRDARTGPECGANYMWGQVEAWYEAAWWSNITQVNLTVSQQDFIISLITGHKEKDGNRRQISFRHTCCLCVRTFHRGGNGSGTFADTGNNDVRAGAAGAVTQPCVTAAHFARNPVYLHPSARPDK